MAKLKPKASIRLENLRFYCNICKKITYILLYALNIVVMLGNFSKVFKIL